MLFTTTHRSALALAANNRSQKAFRSRYANSKSEIIEFFPRGAVNGVFVRFRCHLCGQVKTENIRARRKDNGDLLCGDCLYSSKISTRAERGWKPTIVRKFTSEQVSAELLARGVTPTFDQYLGPSQKLTFKCGCGMPGEITWRNLHYQDPRTTVKATPRCTACQLLARRAWAKAKCRPPVSYGPNHPNWNPDLTDEERAENETRGPEYERWAEAVRRNAGYRCELSGEGGEVQSHHVRWWSRHPDQRYDPANGVCLTLALHKLFHSLYRPTQTPDEVVAWQEFKGRYEAGEFFDLPKAKSPPKKMTAEERHARYVRFRDSRTPEQQVAFLAKARAKHHAKKAAQGGS